MGIEPKRRDAQRILSPSSIPIEFTLRQAAKPDKFYNLVKEVSPEPRIDMFSREKREGFAQYGNELDRFLPKHEPVIYWRR